MVQEKYGMLCALTQLTQSLHQQRFNLSSRRFQRQRTQPCRPPAPHAQPITPNQIKKQTSLLLNQIKPCVAHVPAHLKLALLWACAQRLGQRLVGCTQRLPAG
jgi:hypothetical protein